MYATLELSKDANQTQIKRAFHKLAKEYHPDRGGCEEKFKKLTEAYQILCDPDKKKLYDMFGVAGVQNGGRGMAGFGCRGIFRRQRKTEDLRYPLKVQLKEFYNGSKRTLQLTKEKICQNCKGFGGKPEGIVICKDCEGRGIRIIHGGGQPLPHYEPCTSCNRSGKSIHPQFVCNVCQGRRVVKSTKRLEVVIGKGMCGGNKRIFPQEANEEPGALPGDVIVTFDEQDHKNFKREGIHLRVKKTITLMEAFGGFKFTIKHLDNRLLAIRSEPGVVYKPGDVKTIREEGMPAPRDPFTFGNLFVQFEVAFPDRMSHEHLQILGKVFPVPRPVVIPTEALEVNMISTNVEDEKRNLAHLTQARKNCYDEDNPEEQRNNCKTQ